MSQDDDLRAALSDALRPPGQLVTDWNATSNLLDGARRHVRRRRILTASATVAAVVAVVTAVGASQLISTQSANPTPLVTPPAPTSNPVSGLVLGVDAGGRFVLEDLAQPAKARFVTVGAGATGEISAGAIAADPGRGWIVEYAIRRSAGEPLTSTRLATVSKSGSVQAFGPTYPAATSMGELAVSPDGSKIAVVLDNETAKKPSVVVMPRPGASGAAQTWTSRDPYINDIQSLSWAPDGTHLTYIAGVTTGAGMSGNPSTLDVTSSSSDLPTDSVPHIGKSGCFPWGAAWLGNTGRFGAILECDGSDRYAEMDPTTAKVAPGGIPLPGLGCGPQNIDALPDASRILLNQCGTLFVVQGGKAFRVKTALTDAVWAGSTGLAPPASGPSVPSSPNGSVSQSDSEFFPATVTAEPLLFAPGGTLTAPPRTLVDDGSTVLPTGTVVPSGALSAQVVVGGETLMGLTGRDNGSPPAPTTYPVLSTDGGRTWRIAGPLFYRPGTLHAAAYVAHILALPGGHVVVWGEGGNGIRVTADLGSHWRQAWFAYGCENLFVVDGVLELTSAGAPGDSHRYRSVDDGLTWRRQN